MPLKIYLKLDNCDDFPYIKSNYSFVKNKEDGLCFTSYCSRDRYLYLWIKKIFGSIVVYSSNLYLPVFDNLMSVEYRNGEYRESRLKNVIRRLMKDELLDDALCKFENRDIAMRGFHHSIRNNFNYKWFVTFEFDDFDIKSKSEHSFYTPVCGGKKIHVLEFIETDEDIVLFKLKTKLKIIEVQSSEMIKQKYEDKINEEYSKDLMPFIGRDYLFSNGE